MSSISEINYTTDKISNPSNDQAEAYSRYEKNLVPSEFQVEDYVSVLERQVKREEEIYDGERVKTISIKGENKYWKDFLPYHIRDKFDDNGYPVNVEDEYYVKASCHQVSAQIGLYSTSEHELMVGDAVQIVNERTEIVKDGKFRDIVQLVNPKSGKVVHSCNIILKDGEDYLVFSKNGSGIAVPLIVTKLSDVKSKYDSDYPYELDTVIRREKPKTTTF